MENTTLHSFRLMDDICTRFEAILDADTLASYPTRLDRLIDLEHATEQFDLDLKQLLAADDVNFIHDVAGIHQHMDRRTGLVGGCFLPRFARSKE